MPKRYPFVVSDENVINSYGFRVLTTGIETKQFKKNPIVLWMHRRPSLWGENNNKDGDHFPIGLAYNLRRDPENDGRLLADIEFDQNDEFAKKIEQKVESGHLRMCSPGLEPITVSDDPKYLLSGQTRRSLIKCTLVEISIADIGSNPNSLKLYNADTELIELSADNANTIIPLLNSKSNFNTTDTKMEKNQLLVTLAAGLDMAPETTESEMLRHVLQLSTENNSLKQKLEAMEKAKTEAEKEIKLKAKTDYLKLAFDQKVITGEQMKVYENEKYELADLKILLGDLKPAINLSKIPGSVGTGKGPWETRMEEIQNK